MAKIPESLLEKIADLIIGEGYPSLPSRQRKKREARKREIEKGHRINLITVIKIGFLY